MQSLKHIYAIIGNNYDKLAASDWAGHALHVKAPQFTLAWLFMFQTVMKLEAACTVATWPQGRLP